MSDLIFWLKTGASFFLAACAMFVLVHLLMTMECNNYNTITGKETKVKALTCYVKQDGQWYTYEELKLRNATKGN